MQAPDRNDPAATRSRAELLLLATVLVAAYHGVEYWLVARVLPGREWYERFGPHAMANIRDGLSLIVPLLLCLGAPRRSGLLLGEWRGKVGRVLAICTVPVVLTAIVYPLTSRPFTGGAVGMWAISPTAQELMFSGYLYGLFGLAFPGRAGRLPVDRAVLIAAAFFAAWHLPNFASIHPGYVVFQLAYTFAGGAWTMLARQTTGSILPCVLTHSAVNFVSWMGW
ncbi:MAG: CPBP family intramembrane metalloprotease [bacterium]|nr:CPBP family intramembrane metalloprotease [bacterium]